MEKESKYSPVSAIKAALPASLILTIVFWSGQKQKYKTNGPPMEVIDALELFPIAFLALFLFFYILKLLGVKIKFF